MIEENTLKSLAKKFHIDTITILREYIQLVFLKNLYSLKQSEKILFKEGTLIHLLLGSPRFSEDLDFTAILEKEKLQKVVNKAAYLSLEEIPNLKIRKIKNTETSYEAKIIYKDNLKYPVAVKLDFSLREKPLTKVPTILETVFPISYYPVIMHLGNEEILAEKIRAILVRGKGRDLFDIYFLLSKGVKLNKKFIEEKLKFYNLSYSFDELIKAVENFSDKSLKTDLGKFLPPEQRKIIPYLKNETIKKLKEQNFFT